MNGQVIVQSQVPVKPTLTPVVSGWLQRCTATSECSDCRKKREGTLQRAAINSSSVNDVPPIVHEVLRSPGQPLDVETRAFMEPHFGHDFSNVRVHTDAKAAESARAVNAFAFTIGRNVVFGAGQYMPETRTGRRLLAHELTHTLQQGSASSQPANTFAITDPDDATEREAETASQSVEQEHPIAPTSMRIAQLARQADPRQPTPPGQAAADVAQDAGSCSPSMPGKPPTSGNCSAYALNSWWLPMAYINNATCACLTTPNSRTANCVRAFLQDRLAATPTSIKIAAAAQKANDNPLLPSYPVYQAFVQTFLTPRIYQDHVDAYASCCCPSGPAPYLSWIGVTTVPIRPCSLVGQSIRHFGSCHGTPGHW